MKVEEKDEQNIYKEEGTIGDAAALSGSLYLSQALYLIRGFLIAQLLGPSSYGVWSVFKSFFEGAPYLGLGTQQAMLREVPFSSGKGDETKKSIIIQTSLSWNILLTSIIMILIFIISSTRFGSGYRIEIRLAGILFVLNAIHLFMWPKFKSEQKILLLSKYMLSYAVLNTTFGLALLVFFKLNGLLLGMILAQLILLTYLIRNNHISIHLHIDKTILIELFNVGFPIMILWLLFFLMGNVDRFIIFLTLGKTQTGFYSLAGFISSIVTYISYTITTVIFPRMMYVYGKTGEKKYIEKYFEKPIAFLSVFVPIILCVIYINIGSIINLLLPQYLPGIGVLHILIIALFFSTICGLPVNLIIALNKQKKFMYITALIFLLSIILDFIIIRLGFGMNGVGLVTAFIFFLASLIANGYALKLLKDNKKEIYWNLFLIYLPFIYSFTVMFLLISNLFIYNILLDNLLKSIIFILLIIPFIFYVEKKSNAINKFLSSFRKS